MDVHFTNAYPASRDTVDPSISRSSENRTASLRARSIVGSGVDTRRAVASARARSNLGRIADYVALMKPRVMSLVVFTAVVGLLSAPGPIEPTAGFLAILCIAAGAGSAGALNMWYDADIDAMMARTASRPIPQGRVRAEEALALGLGLAAASVMSLGLLINVAAAGLLAVTICFYVLVYTVWLKRATPYNIVVGGASGAFPPMIAWAAATGTLSVEPLLLFLIIFLWTPPHFWALSLCRADDYARAGVPMLPVVAGKVKTRGQILLYTVLLFPASLLPWALGFAGPIYGAVAIAAGARMMFLAWQLRTGGRPEGRAAGHLFAFSIAYLFALFAAYLVQKALTAHSWLSMGA
jgi:protoheme IX farnesyltransferase